MRDYTPPPVNAREILGSPVHFIAFGFGTGLSPKGPGTVGTLAGLPLFWLLQSLPLATYLALCALLFVFGCWVCGTSAKRLGVHDHGGIVFDEIVGLLASAAPLLALPLDQRQTLMGLVLAFGAFRLFDILKPWPIRAIDARVGGGFGIMLDDLIAALMAAAVLFAVAARVR